jgi:hypothetical protein
LSGSGCSVRFPLLAREHPGSPTGQRGRGYPKTCLTSPATLLPHSPGSRRRSQTRSPSSISRENHAAAERYPACSETFRHTPNWGKFGRDWYSLYRRPPPPGPDRGSHPSLAHRAEGRSALGPVRLRNGAPLPEWEELLAEVLRLAQPERREGADNAGHRI